MTPVTFSSYHVNLKSQRDAELKTSLESLTRSLAASFKIAAPDLWLNATTRTKAVEETPEV